MEDRGNEGYWSTSNLNHNAQILHDRIGRVFCQFRGITQSEVGVSNHLQNAIQIRKQQLISRRPAFAAVSASNPDAPKKKRRKKRPRPSETELAPDQARDQSTAAPSEEGNVHSKQQSWFPWQRRQEKKEPQSESAAGKARGDNNSSSQSSRKSFFPWSQKTGIRHPPVEESEFVRSLDEVRYEPQDEVDRKILEIEELRPKLSPAQNADLDKILYDELAKAGVFKLVDDEGNEVSLRRYLKKVAQSVQRRQMDADEPQIQKISHETKMSRIHGSQLRQDKTKMWLRPEEEEALELDLFGRGDVCSPRKLFGQQIGRLHDFAFGVFGRIPETRAFLQNWAGRDPQKVLKDQDFYDQLTYFGPLSELTVMLVAHRPLPLLELRNKFLDRHARIAAVGPFSDQPEALPDSTKHILANLKKRWTVENLEHSGLIDKKGCVIPGSKLILTCGIGGQLSAEAITAGTLAEQATVPITTWQDPRFTCNVLQHFLGRQPVDLLAKERIGNGALWVANGFDFRPPEKQNNPNVSYASYSEDIAEDLHQANAVEGIRNRRDLFSIAETGKQPMLLNSEDVVVPALF